MGLKEMQVNKEYEMIALISQCEKTIKGLQALLNMPERQQDKSGLHWLSTGHGEFAMGTLRMIQNFKKEHL